MCPNSWVTPRGHQRAFSFFSSQGCEISWVLFPGHTNSSAVLSCKSCPTLFEPMDCSPPSSSFHGILQTRTLEWVAISFSRGFSQPKDSTCFSGPQPWQAGSLPLSHLQIPVDRFYCADFLGSSQGTGSWQRVLHCQLFLAKLPW